MKITSCTGNAKGLGELQHSIHRTNAKGCESGVQPRIFCTLVFHCSERYPSLYSKNAVVGSMNQMCMGARDKIFDHFLSRNSAPTILDNRVPIGSPFLLMRTQALSSNRIRLPSFRRSSFLALTTTAWRMSPLRTLLAMLKLEPPGVSGPKDFCFCTTTMILSPARDQPRVVQLD